MSSSFLFSSSMLLVIAFAAAAAASGGGDGRHDADPQQTPAAAPANPAPIHPSAKTITIVPAADVDAAFKKGYGFVESSEFKINAGRRDAAGGAEVHARDTDIFYILEGSAVLVTGGTVIDSKTISPGEVRGTGLTGGESHNIKKGDVVIVPRGLPHWFKETPQVPVLYFVVKTTAPDGAK
jgi:mannose-6-phosphate isomerase-like protein (cupin superfamily)